MKIVLFLIVCGILVVMALIEVGKFLSARRTPGEFPYPPARLGRRIAISLIFSTVVGMVAFWPDGAPVRIQLPLMGVLLTGLVTGLVLLWLDLSETSKAAVEEANRLNRQVGESFMEIVAEQQRQGHEPRPTSQPEAPES